jgi:hypothetical protein
MYVTLRRPDRIEYSSLLSKSYSTLATVSTISKPSFSGTVHRSCAPLNSPDKNARGWWSCPSIGRSSCSSCICVLKPKWKRSEVSVKTQILLSGSGNANVIDSMIAACKSLKAACSSGPQRGSSDTAAAAFFVLRLLFSNTFASAA